MILGKTGFRAKKITGDRGEYYIRLEGSKKKKQKKQKTKNTPANKNSRW